MLALLAVSIAGGCRRGKETPVSPNAANKVSVRSVRLYYESPRMLLASEPRNIPLPENTAAAIPIVLRELIKGPASPTSLRLFPEGTSVRGAYLLPEGTAVVDLGGAKLTEGWGTGSHTELMAAYSIIQTLASNFAEAKRVHVLINGTPAETLAGHISLARPLTPRPDLLDPQAR